MILHSEYLQCCFHPSLSKYFEQLIQLRADGLSDRGQHSVRCAMNIPDLLWKFYL